MATPNDGTAADASPDRGRRPCRRLAIVLAALLMPAALTLIVHPAAALASGVSTIVVDSDGRTVHAQNADRRAYPASLTKMMTLYMLFDALEQRRIRLNDRIRISGNAAAKPPTQLGLSRGETIRVRDAILALTTKSANDVAAAVAERLAGSETQFAQRMTAKARALGMRRTVFRNASGLPHPGQVSTARDMAILGQALIRDFPQYYSYFGVSRFRYRGAVHANHNRLLGVYRGMDGIKTGYTNAAGFNLVASARRDGKRLIGVVMGADSAAGRNATMARLLDRGFRDATTVVAAAPTKVAKKRRFAAAAAADKRAAPARARQPNKAVMATKPSAQKPQAAVVRKQPYG
jgi:D-alanyl-D-alanine carboxypeptidase